MSHPSPTPLTSHVRAGLGDTGGGLGGRERAGIEGWGWGSDAEGWEQRGGAGGAGARGEAGCSGGRRCGQGDCKNLGEGQGWARMAYSTGGRTGGKVVARRVTVRDGCRVRSVRALSR